MLPNNSRTEQTHQSTWNNMRPSLAFVVLIFIALFAFEVFNYSTTDYAMQDLLGNLSFMGIYWSTILAIAFCGIDFAGIARLFTPEQGMGEPKEVWYLFGAWLLAATMNAILTWWGVSMAIVEHVAVAGSTVVDAQTMVTVVPVFVAIMVWVIRILIIGTLSLAMDRLLHPGLDQQTMMERAMSRRPTPTLRTGIPSSLNTGIIAPRPNPAHAAAPRNSAPRGSVPPRTSAPVTRQPVEEDDLFSDVPARPRSEPTYHSMSGSARRGNGGGGQPYQRP
jgi:hypothetical protein